MIRPFLLGAAMAALMLWMWHERIMSGNFDLTSGAIVFALAHVAVLGLSLVAGMLLPAVRRAVLRHRPHRGHVVGMMFGMVTTGLAVHAVMQGGGV